MTAQVSEPIVKSHGDKLAHAAGQTPAAKDTPPVAESEPPIKREGDKMSGAVAKAVGPH